VIPQPIRDGDDPCVLASQWGLSLRLAARLIAMSRDALDLGLMIISGGRTCEEQMELALAGRPATDCETSTHVACPATGADLWTTPSPTDHRGNLNPLVVGRFGAAAVFAGLRWGGGSPKNALGIPSDWNHVDLGPRR